MKPPVWKPLYHLLRIFGCPAAWEISVGSVVFRLLPDGRRAYLLLHYPSGHFDFAKGHIEKGETEEETLRRETEEETGITDLAVYSKRVSISYFYTAKGNERARRIREGRGLWIFKDVHFYPAETKTEAVRLSHEHIGSVWLPYEEALSRVTFENARRVLRETESYLASKHSHSPSARDK